MIAIASSSVHERTAFAGLCDSHGWSSVEWDTVRTAVRLLQRTSPRVLLLRHKLNDGYSDDVIAALKAAPRGSATKVIVLIGAGTSSAAEARQLALGADCIQRDPIHTDVLLAYVSKYFEAPRHARILRSQRDSSTIPFAGATLHVADRTLKHLGKIIPLTPREVGLAEQLFHSRGEVIGYETLFVDVLGRRYRGDTSNMRVLLGKLAASTSRLEIELRRWVEVIPKTGYRYNRQSLNSL